MFDYCELGMIRIEQRFEAISRLTPHCARRKIQDSESENPGSGNKSSPLSVLPSVRQKRLRERQDMRWEVLHDDDGTKVKVTMTVEEAEEFIEAWGPNGTEN